MSMLLQDGQRRRDHQNMHGGDSLPETKSAAALRRLPQLATTVEAEDTEVKS
jgi:hypothetical protein